MKQLIFSQCINDQSEIKELKDTKEKIKILRTQQGKTLDIAILGARVKILIRKLESIGYSIFDIFEAINN